MRIASKIESKWIKDYIAKMKDVDVSKLADIPNPKNNGSVLNKRPNNVDLEEVKAEETEKRNSKIEEAKKRFNDRKKVKK